MKGSKYFGIQVYETNGVIDFVTVSIGNEKNKAKAIHKLDGKDEIDGIIEELTEIRNRM